MKDLNYTAEKLNNEITAHSNHIESVYSEIVYITSSESTTADKINSIRVVIQNHDTSIFNTAKALLGAPIKEQEFIDSEPTQMDMDGCDLCFGKACNDSCKKDPKLLHEDGSCDACYYGGKICDESCHNQVDEAESTGV
tara:strand:- start:1272 stop:1688 length:417 start_codon:yes stop_codon:yes gene_type:complete